MKFSSKLALLLLSIVLLLVGAIFFVFHSFTLESMEAQIEAHIEDMAEHTMDEFEKMLFERQADIQVFAGDSILRSGNSTPEEIMKRLMDFRNQYKVYASLSFFGPDRVRLVDTSGMNIGEVHSSVPWSEDALVKGIVSAGRDVRVAEDLKIPCVYFAAPVHDLTGNLLGAVVSRMPVEILYDTIRKNLSSPYVKMKVKVDLVDREGVLIYSNHIQGGILEEKPWRDLKAWNSSKRGEKKSKTIRHSHLGEGEYLSIFVEERGYLDFAGNGWALILHVPVKEAFAPVLRLREKVLFTLVLITSVSLLLALFFSKAASQSLIKLKDAALRIGGGDLEAKIEVHSRDEIGQLAAAFNQMAGDLKRDIAQREKMAEQNRLILEKTIDGFWIVDLDGRILEVNDAYCRIIGYSREELLSMRILDIEAAESPKETAEHIQRVVREGTDYFESRHRRKDGAIIDVEVSVNFVDTDGGRFFSFVREITERKRAQEALMREVEKLGKANAELENFNRLTVGRELKMIELKREINDLLEELGREKKYRIHRPEE